MPEKSHLLKGVAMPSFDGLNMDTTLVWYEQNIDELEERITNCFLNHHHPLPKRIEQVIRQINFLEGHNLESVGLHTDDIAQVFSCFNPGFWQRSGFTELSICPPLWFTMAMQDCTSKAMPTANIDQALSQTHCVAAYTKFTIPPRYDPDYGILAHIYLSKLGAEVSPDVRRVVAIYSLMRELTSTMIRPILSRVDNDRHLLKLKNGDVVDEFEYLEEIYAAYEELDDGVSHYSHAYKAESKTTSSEVPFVIEICESVAALMLDFVFCEHGALYNFEPFDDRAKMRKYLIYLITAYKHVPQ
jgi:hypothetical protein